MTVNGLVSSQFEVTSGVPQDSVLGLLLFFIYVNDIASTITNADSRLYTDDTLLGMDICSNDSSKLQEIINTLSQWTDCSSMSFNTSKCVRIKVTAQI